MTLSRNLFLYKRAIKLRKVGKSYNEISKSLGLPKSTLSNWLSNKKWSQTLSIQLDIENRERSSNFLKNFNRRKHIETIKRHTSYKEEARKSYQKLKDNKLFLTGISIYWGEGEKTNRGRVSIVNSDVDMLKVMMVFYRKIIQIPESKLRAALFLYHDIDEGNAVKFWSENLSLDQSQFIKTQILPSRSSLTKHKVKNGMCNLYFSSVEVDIKIREWIRLLSKEIKSAGIA